MKVFALGLLLVLHYGINSVSSLQTEDGVNEIIDYVLYSAEQYLKENNLIQIDIPDVDVTYDNVVIDGSTINGFIKGKTGKLGDTTTLTRVGNATIDFIGEDVMILRSNFTLNIINVHYDQFNFKLWIGGNDGGVDAHIGDNQFHIQITLTDNDQECKVTIDEAQTVKIGGIELTLLPPSFSTYFKNKIYSAYINAHPGIITYALDPLLKSNLQKASDELDLCSYLKPLRQTRL